MLRRWRAPIVWAILILVLTSIPVPGISAPVGSDKGVHGILYLVLGLLSTQALLAERAPRLWHLLLLVGALLAFGALDELHQAWIPGRIPDARDLVADAIGSIAGIVVALVLARSRPRRAA